jgi:pimeloyl-ACP methyl ester carboxylesterase
MRHRTIDIDGLKVFYREAGAAGAPALLLLHGFPSSSHMFRELIPLVSDAYHVVTPDLPGFGYTDSLPATDSRMRRAISALCVSSAKCPVG